MTNAAAARAHLDTLLAHPGAAIELLAGVSGALGRAGTLAFAETGFSPLASPRKWWVMRHVRRDLERAQVHLGELRRLHAEARSWPEPPEALSLAWAALELAVEGELDRWVDVEIHHRIETKKVELDALLDEVGRLHARLRALDPATA